MLLLPILGNDFFPAVDAGQFQLHIRAKTGTRIEETARLVDQIERSIGAKIPANEVSGLLDNIGVPTSGINLSYSNSGIIGSGDAIIIGSLAPKHHPTFGYVEQLRTELPKEFPGTAFFFEPADIVSQTLNFGLPAPINVQIVGKDLQGNFKVATAMQEKIRSIPGGRSHSAADGSTASEQASLPEPATTKHAAPADPQTRGKHSRLLWFLLIPALLLGLGLYRWRKATAAHKALAATTSAGVAEPVTVQQPQFGQHTSDLVLPATLQAFSEAPVYARVSGYLARWYTDIGHSVRSGDLLAVIEAPEVDQQLIQARAALGQTEANLQLANTTT